MTAAVPVSQVEKRRAQPSAVATVQKGRAGGSTAISDDGCASAISSDGGPVGEIEGASGAGGDISGGGGASGKGRCARDNIIQATPILADDLTTWCVEN